MPPADALEVARQLISAAERAHTRAPRPGEVDGRDYRFLTQTKFDNRLGRGKSAEHSWSFLHSYGLLRSEIEAVPEDCVGIAVLDLVGALALRVAFPDSVVSFALRPVSWDMLATRLLERGGNPADTVRRLASARKESCRAEDMCDDEIRVGSVRQSASEILAISAVHGFRLAALGSQTP